MSKLRQQAEGKEAKANGSNTQQGEKQRRKEYCQENTDIKRIFWILSQHIILGINPVWLYCINHFVLLGLVH